MKPREPFPLNLAMNGNLKLVIVGVGLVSTAAVAVSPRHKPALKSLQRAQKECKQYLHLPTDDDTEGDCEQRCVQLVLRSWNDSSGLSHLPYSRHFKPDCDDKCYPNRTAYCLRTELEHVPSCDACRRATVSWECYRDQYGSLIGSPKLVPATELLVRNSIIQCAKILNIAELDFESFIKSGFLLSDRSRCLFRCSVVRLGLFNDISGPDLDRLYVQSGGGCGGTEEEKFKKDASQCVAKLRDKCLDNCTLATRAANDCFERGSGALNIILRSLLRIVIPLIMS
ncbi:general odorant-binding protein 45-like [Toxorhynchites rutilus septentrionalis]|uniref:general odorant-binding protein 45-like n=1 Tax=Toxorhynchites rutilus septentrionalis TaxID=329112 RepID=UPI00247A1761|nr:general odorant-binding protein 45-like [Toxorhynchites rutilus septentrionalis]